MIFICYDLGIFFSNSMKDYDIFSSMRLNMFLLRIMVMLKVIFITCSMIYGEFIKPGVLQVINPLLKMHLVVTNRSFWISLLSQETVHYALVLHDEGNATYDVNLVTNTATDTITIFHLTMLNQNNVSWTQASNVTGTSGCMRNDSRRSRGATSSWIQLMLSLAPW